MYTNILIPVALAEEHDTKGSFEVAKAIAEDGAQFHVVHVMESMPAYASSQIPVEILARSRDEMRTMLDTSVKDLPGAETELINGHPGQAIVDYASKNGIDCIVIASHKPGLEDFFLGSTAARVVRHAKCAVHVLR